MPAWSNPDECSPARERLAWAGESRPDGGPVAYFSGSVMVGARFSIEGASLFEPRDAFAADP
jgi:hypothetical protein